MPPRVRLPTRTGAPGARWSLRAAKRRTHSTRLRRKEQLPLHRPPPAARPSPPPGRRATPPRRPKQRVAPSMRPQMATSTRTAAAVGSKPREARVRLSARPPPWAHREAVPQPGDGDNSHRARGHPPSAEVDGNPERRVRVARQVVVAAVDGAVAGEAPHAPRTTSQPSS